MPLGRSIAVVIASLVLGLTGAAAPYHLSLPQVYTGMCDASAGVALGTNLFAAANDEGNQIRVYRNDAGGDPVQVVDVSAFVNPLDKSPEMDLEGAAWLQDTI